MRHRLDLLAVLGERVRLGIESTRLARRVIGADDQARISVAAIADASDVSPRVGRIGSVHADRCTVHAALRLLGRVGLAPTGIVEHKLICGQRNRLPHGLGSHSLGQGIGNRLGGLLAARGVDGVAHAINPGVVRLAIARSAACQAVPLEQLRQQGPQLFLNLVFPLMEIALLIHAESHRLPEQGVGVLFTGEIEQGPGAPREDDSVNVDVILHHVLQVVVRLIERAVRERRERALGSSHVQSTRCLAQSFRSRLARRQLCRLDHMKCFVRRPSHLLDVTGIAVKDFHDRQCAPWLG